MDKKDILTKIRYILIFVLVILLGFVGIGLLITTCKITADEIISRNVSDSLKYKDTELSNKTAYITQLEMESADQLLKLNSQDSMIQQLQSRVRYYEDRLSHGTVIEVITKTELDTIVIIDTIMGENLFSYKDEWIQLTGEILESNLRFSLKTFDSYTIAQLDDNTVEISNQNPYSTVIGLNSFKISPKDSPWGIGVHVGCGFSYDLFSKNLGFGPSISIGLTYKFL
jgi:hypothetical protein